MPKNFLYYLLEEDGRSIKVQNGVVTSTSTPTPLPQTPDKWQEISVSWERDLTKHGIQRTFSTAIDLVRDGAHIIREAFYTTNVERKIYLLIQRLTLELDTNFFQWLYKYFYKGQIDLSSCNDGDNSASVNIMEAKLNRMLKANENTDYEIDIDNDAEMKHVKMDGIKLRGVYSWILPELTEGETDKFTFMGLLSSSEKAPGISVFDVTAMEETPGGPLTSDITEYFLSADRMAEATTGTITATVNILTAETRERTITVAKYNVFTGVSSAVNIMAGTTGGPGVYDINYNVSIENGDRLFLVVQEYFNEFTLTFTTASKYSTTYIKGLTVFTLYKRLIEKITGSDTYAQSELLQQYENIIITSGDAIRGLTGKIKTSLNKFFQSMDAVLCAGMAIENDKIVLEDRAHFYDDSSPIAIGNVKDCKRNYAKEVMANTFRIGYPDSKIDDVNGKYEFNNSHLYTSPITQVVKEYPILSAYKTSPYLIETTRINLDGKATTDNSSDNEVFMLNTEPDQASTAEATVSFLQENNLMICSSSLNFIIGQTFSIAGSALGNDRVYKVLGIANFLTLQFVALESVPAGANLVDETDVTITITWLSGIIQKLKRVTYDSIEGIPTESISTIFNIELFTPKRMLLKHGKWIRAMLHGFDMDKLVFQTTEKNRGLKTTLGTEVIDEDADQPIDELDEPLFIPKWLEFEGEVPVELVELFEANANRCFEYIDRGVTYRGFNIKSSLMINTLQPQGFRLLSVATNNFDELVF